MSVNDDRLQLMRRVFRLRWVAPEQVYFIPTGARPVPKTNSPIKNYSSTLVGSFLTVGGLVNQVLVSSEMETRYVLKSQFEKEAVKRMKVYFLGYSEQRNKRTEIFHISLPNKVVRYLRLL